MPSDAAMKVWREAAYAYGGQSIEGAEGETYAAAVIERAIADAVERERAKAEALAEALRDCAEDLAEYVNAQWGFDERLERQLKRDMAPVERARAALKAWEATPPAHPE